MLTPSPVLLLGASAVEQGWGWKGIFSALTEEPDGPNPPGQELRKPSLSPECFLTRGCAADTQENRICRSEPRIPGVVLVGTWSQPKVLKSIASVGREPPKPLDFHGRESKKAFGMPCPLCRDQSRNQMFCLFLFSRCLCLRYRPSINPGGQDCVSLNRCATKGFASSFLALTQTSFLPLLPSEPSPRKNSLSPSAPGRCLWLPCSQKGPSLWS